jgi:hypothetical protein
VSSDPTLVLPVRFKLDDVIAQLKALGTAGKKAGDDVDDGMGKGKKGAKGLGDEMAGLIRTQLSLSAVQSTAVAIGQEFNRSAEYVKKLATEFADLRQAMQQVAALKGESNSNEFTVNEARQAAAANLTPGEWKKFQEQFQSYGGAYLEGDQARFVQRGEVSAKTQAEQYQAHIVEFAKARGINPDEAAQLGGALLQFSQGPGTTEGFEAQFGKIFKTLERAPTPVSQLLPQMSRVMAMGAGPEEAAAMLAIMSEAMPGEEETGVINAVKAINNQVLEGKGGALGQKKDMTPLERVKAAVSTIHERVAKGEDLDKILHKVAPDLREARGIRGFLTRGLEAGGFERMEGYQRDNPADFLDQARKEYEESDEGRAAKTLADLALARAERGAAQQDVAAELARAEVTVTRRGDMENPNAAAELECGALGRISGVTPEQQRINEEALRNVQRRARAAGVTDVAPESLTGFSGAFGSQGEINAEIKRLLEEINKKMGKTADNTEKTAAGVKPVIAAPPPRPGNRM